AVDDRADRGDLEVGLERDVLRPVGNVGGQRGSGGEACNEEEGRGNRNDSESEEADEPPDSHGAAPVSHEYPSPHLIANVRTQSWYWGHQLLSESAQSADPRDARHHGPSEAE